MRDAPLRRLVAERIDILASRERIESGSGAPRERDASVVLRGVRPPARGDVFECGVSKGERGVLLGDLGDRAAVRLQANVLEPSARWLPSAWPHVLRGGVRAQVAPFAKH